ncbi:ABC transporter permease [Nocardioides sp. QY071]|uniref:ABC transporter permease n=1 Tax=Nocardioides sp. QY071 TaxID=3044187 RepID=UPI00249CD4F5|nr:ABC transporter permease [Nocardioides sp. QY071]WGY00465.1 ABC transporter permease [Nocardioides sp. QY071]
MTITDERETTTGAAGGTADRSSKARVWRVAVIALERYALVLLGVSLVVLFASLEGSRDAFVSTANIRTLLGNQSVVALIAIASIIPLVTGQIDLSAGPVAGLSGVVTAGLCSFYDFPLVPAVLVTLLVGAVIGLVNGYLVSYVGVGAIIVTLGSATLIQAGVSWFSEDRTIVSGIPDRLVALGSGSFLGVPTAVFYVIVVSLVAHYFLSQTPPGRHLYFVGANARASRLVGLRVEALTLASFVASAVIASMAGILQLALAGSASPQVGPNFTLPALAAAFLGATVIRPGTFNVPGTLVAVLFVAVVVNGLTLLGAPSWLQPAVNGLSLLVAVVIATVAGKRRAAG